jgi:hypothetical protein
MRGSEQRICDSTPEQTLAREQLDSAKVNYKPEGRTLPDAAEFVDISMRRSVS